VKEDGGDEMLRTSPRVSVRCCVREDHCPALQLGLVRDCSDEYTNDSSSEATEIHSTYFAGK
jgi:hypothetical protein